MDDEWLAWAWYVHRTPSDWSYPDEFAHTMKEERAKPAAAEREREEEAGPRASGLGALPHLLLGLAGRVRGERGLAENASARASTRELSLGAEQR